MHCVPHNHLAGLTLPEFPAIPRAPFHLRFSQSVRCFSHDDKVPARLKTSTDVGGGANDSAARIFTARAMPCSHFFFAARGESLSLCTPRGGVRPSGRSSSCVGRGPRVMIVAPGGWERGREGHYSSRLAVVEKSGGRTDV